MHNMRPYLRTLSRSKSVISKTSFLFFLLHCQEKEKEKLIDLLFFSVRNICLRIPIHCFATKLPDSISVSYEGEKEVCHHGCSSMHLQAQAQIGGNRKGTRKLNCSKKRILEPNEGTPVA